LTSSIGRKDEHLKMFGLSGLAALAVLAVIGPASAYATALYKGSNVKLGVGTKSTSLVAGTAAVLTTTDGTTLVTCAISENEGQGEGEFVVKVNTTILRGGLRIHDR
jgi:hypothetical protein